ncbi:MAG: hypothetical protein GF393_00255 [Armatimonadia bacterium]|nr:hypothetical protein [Armatimonadia bacterium]
MSKHNTNIRKFFRNLAGDPTWETDGETSRALAEGAFWFMNFTAMASVWLESADPAKAAVEIASLERVLRSRLAENGWLQALDREADRVREIVLDQVARRDLSGDITAVQVVEQAAAAIRN